MLLEKHDLLSKIKSERILMMIECWFFHKYSGIPWSNITAMRNRLIHVYFDIDLDRVWDTIVDDLPPLIDNLEKQISREDPPSK
jgi:uncharacterized protein with HEPN domain